MKKTRFFPFVIAWLLVAASAACNDVTPPDGGTEVIEFDFTDQAHGWTGDFSDYRPEQGEQMELVAAHEPLPEGVEREGSGLRVAGTNHSDDLFMFWKGRAEGLLPDTEYQVRFEVEFATNAPSGCAGIGGPPGEAVRVKVGATRTEPEPVIEQVAGDDYYRMNIDKGNQSTGGEDAFVIGDVSSSNTDCNDWIWEMKTLESGTESYTVTTDGDGSVWLIVGTDSGFEGRTALFYTMYRATFTPV